MRSITLPAPAKINLFLHINGRRSDGYHDLQTLFQLLDYGDEITLHERRDNRLTLECSVVELNSDNNLVLKAARALRQLTGTERGAHIQLNKKLPAGGGIGGGSSDAATTLLGLNHLWQLQLPNQQLLTLARELGADVPVFVNGKTAFAQGVGEILQPLDLAENWFVIIAPNCPVSTAEVFSHKGLTRDTPVIKVAASFEQGTRNDCQALVRKLYKPVDEALNWLSKFGEAKLTGTGSCVFLKVDTESDAQAIFEQRPIGWQGFTARGINQSPVLSLLQAL